MWTICHWSTTLIEFGHHRYLEPDHSPKVAINFGTGQHAVTTWMIVEQVSCQDSLHTEEAGYSCLARVYVNQNDLPCFQLDVGQYWIKQLPLNLWLSRVLWKIHSPKHVSTERPTSRRVWSVGTFRLPPATSDMAISLRVPFCQATIRPHCSEATSLAAR